MARLALTLAALAAVSVQAQQGTGVQRDSGALGARKLTAAAGPKGAAAFER